MVGAHERAVRLYTTLGQRRQPASHTTRRRASEAKAWLGLDMMHARLIPEYNATCADPQTLRRASGTARVGRFSSGEEPEQEGSERLTHLCGQASSKHLQAPPPSRHSTSSRPSSVKACGRPGSMYSTTTTGYHCATQLNCPGPGCWGCCCGCGDPCVLGIAGAGAAGDGDGGGAGLAGRSVVLAAAGVWGVATRGGARVRRVACGCSRGAAAALDAWRAGHAGARGHVACEHWGKGWAKWGTTLTGRQRPCTVSQVRSLLPNTSHVA